jgi:rod shape determining protein RodA
MSYLEYSVRKIPTGFNRLAYINLPIIILLIAIASIGFLMLFSVAGGSIEPWAKVQMIRFSIGFFLMLLIAFIPIWFCRNISGLAYFIGCRIFWSFWHGCSAVDRFRIYEATTIGGY